MKPAASFAYYEDGWKIPQILKRDHELEETAENNRQQFFPAQWEALLLEQLAPQSKTNASRIMLAKAKR